MPPPVGADSPDAGFDNADIADACVHAIKLTDTDSTDVDFTDIDPTDANLNDSDFNYELHLRSACGAHGQMHDPKL